MQFVWRLTLTAYLICSSAFVAAEEVASIVEGYEMSFPAMGSTFHISAYTDNETKLAESIKRAQREVQRLNDIFSDYNPTSELQQLLASKDPCSVKLSDDLFAILQLSKQWHQRTSGVFDPSIGAVTHLWRKKRQADALPTSAEVADALSHCGWHLVQLDELNRRLCIADARVQIDLGGIATGYTVDKCFQMLKEDGFECCLINSGGDIRCGKVPPGRDGWKIEVAPIEMGKEPLRYLTVRNCAITTSGDLSRYVEIDGFRRSHIIDPKTGYGVLGPSAVTVIADTCLEVDVLGTTLSILGESAGLDFIQSNHPNAGAFFAWKPQGSDSIKQNETPNFENSGLR